MGSLAAYNLRVDSEPKLGASAGDGLPPNDSGAGTPSGRVLGLDVGTRRIGIAVSDPLGITAQGLETLQRQNKRLDFEKLEKLARDYAIAEVVVGFPLRMSGAEGVQAEKMHRFADELRKRL